MVCFPTLPKRGSSVGSSRFRSLAIQDAARTVLLQEITLGVIAQLRLLRCVQVIEGAIELVVTMDGRQVFVAVTEVILAKLTRRIALLLQQGGDGRVLRAEIPCLAPGMPTLLIPVRNTDWPVVKDERPAVQLWSA